MAVKEGITTKDGKLRGQVFCTEGKKDNDRRFIGRKNNAINLTKPATARSRMQEKEDGNNACNEPQWA